MKRVYGAFRKLNVVLLIIVPMVFVGLLLLTPLVYALSGVDGGSAPTAYDPTNTPADNIIALPNYDPNNPASVAAWVAAIYAKNGISPPTHAQSAAPPAAPAANSPSDPARDTKVTKVVKQAAAPLQTTDMGAAAPVSIPETPSAPVSQAKSDAKPALIPGAVTLKPHSSYARLKAVLAIAGIIVLCATALRLHFHRYIWLFIKKSRNMAGDLYLLVKRLGTAAIQKPARLYGTWIQQKQDVAEDLIPAISNSMIQNNALASDDIHSANAYLWPPKNTILSGKFVPPLALISPGYDPHAAAGATYVNPANTLRYTDEPLKERGIPEFYRRDIFYTNRSTT